MNPVTIEGKVACLILQDFPPYVLLTAPPLLWALTAIAYPLQDYVAFAVQWPYTASDIEQAHAWLARHGLAATTAPSQ